MPQDKESSPHRFLCTVLANNKNDYRLKKSTCNVVTPCEVINKSLDSLKLLEYFREACGFNSLLVLFHVA